MKRPVYGFTLIELMIALVITAILGIVTNTVFTHHQKLLTHVTNTLSTRDLLREATAILTADLHSTASTSEAFPFASDTAVEFFSVIGASILCQNPTATQIVLPPDTLSNGITLSSWITQPDSTDIALIYHDSSALSPTRGWLRFPIIALASVPSSTACPPSSGFTTSADALHAAYRVTLQTSPPISIQKGTAVRFLRRARYSIYRASDSYWYLGYRRCHPVTGVCEGIQPVSGPYTKDHTPPLTIRYHTSSGPLLTPNAPVSGVTRIDIVARATPKRMVKLRGFTQHPDSVVTIIALRNLP